MTEKVASKRVAGITTMAGGSENDDHLVVPTEISATPSYDANTSKLTDYVGSLAMPRRDLIESEIGLPATPDQNLTAFVNESLVDDGYDSNREHGPPCNAPRVEEG